jgi:hypothetical protein
MSCKRVSLSIRGLVREPGGGSSAGIFERREKYIWVPFLGPEDIKFLSQGPSGTLGKTQGFPELVLDYGAQRARLYSLGASGP